MGNRTVAEVFAKPCGLVGLDDRGRWWITRTTTGLDSCGRTAIEISDGNRVASIEGTPEQLLRLADSIRAQVAGAQANQP